MSLGSFALKSVASSNEANWRSITKGGTVQCLEGLQHGRLRNLFPTMFYTRAHELRCNSYIHNDNERGCYTHTLLTKRSKSRCKHNKGCVTFVALPFTLKSIWRQKNKNYGNSNISWCKNLIFKKNPPKETKILQDIIITLQLISSFKTSLNIIFQKSSYKNRPIYYLRAKIH
jgi:hypothetical protein